MDTRCTECDLFTVCKLSAQRVVNQSIHSGNQLSESDWCKWAMLVSHSSLSAYPRYDYHVYTAAHTKHAGTNAIDWSPPLKIKQLGKDFRIQMRIRTRSLSAQRRSTYYKDWHARQSLLPWRTFTPILLFCTLIRLWLDLGAHTGQTGRQTDW